MGGIRNPPIAKVSMSDFVVLLFSYFLRFLASPYANTYRNLYPHSYSNSSLYPLSTTRPTEPSRMMSLRTIHSSKRTPSSSASSYFSTLIMDKTNENLGLDIEALLEDIKSGRGLRSLVKTQEWIGRKICGRMMML